MEGNDGYLLIKGVSHQGELSSYQNTQGEVSRAF